MENDNRSEIPLVRLQPESVDFIESHLDAYHPGFANPPSHYDANLKRFVLDKPLSEMDDEIIAAHNRAQWALTGHGSTAGTLRPFQHSSTNLPVIQAQSMPARQAAEPIAALKFWDDLFEPSMDRFLQASPNEPKEIKQHGGIRQQHDWTGVFNTLESAKIAYSQTDGSFKGTIRKVYRKTSDHAGGLTLSMVKMAKDTVDSEYISPVLGALRLVLEAAAKASKLRHDMTAAFDDIDRNFVEVEVYVQEFPGDDNIKQASIDLIASVLCAVESVLGFFVSSGLKRALRATFTADDYRKAIDKSLADIKMKSSDLIREVNMSKTQRDHNFQSQSLINDAYTHHVMAQVLSMAHGTKNEFMSMVSGLVDGIKTMQAYQQTSLMVSSMPTSRPLTPISTVASGSSPRIDHLWICPQDILDWIAIPDLAKQDMEYMSSRNFPLVSSAEHGHAQQLVTQHQFRGWLTLPQSSQLLIHGNDGDNLRPVTGLSLFCASMALNFASHPQIIRLLFFCGLHSEKESWLYGADNYDEEQDETIGARAIISSFICQLLCAYDFGPELPLGPGTEEAILEGEVEDLCEIFSILVRQLPSDIVVMCIIDGAAYYERPEFIDDTEVVVAHILQMSTDPAISALIKVIIATSTQTTVIRQPFPDGMILSMAGMADAQWEPSQARMTRILNEEKPAQPSVEVIEFA